MTTGVRNAVALKPFMKSSHSPIRATELDPIENTHRTFEISKLMNIKTQTNGTNLNLSKISNCLAILRIYTKTMTFFDTHGSYNAYKIVIVKNEYECDRICAV